MGLLFKLMREVLEATCGHLWVQVCLFSCSVMSDSWDPVDCSLPGSSVHGILQARILEWVAISFSRDLPNPGIEAKSPALQADV